MAEDSRARAEALAHSPGSKSLPKAKECTDEKDSRRRIDRWVSVH